ncbi:carbon-phosphorus lyase complex subunit [Agrobacterium albertimagni AOL15]|uniref:Carbon-phosphorus lyase complex subunit n=1 Tax=Agrobacterium albertimagni AOL15 TaxID=1156935 RepID=K2PK22_9HYPH|nr:phosphonate C-P lyase system protein PhnH [Agrobacterium albertimagni]EKF61268.1 carbon-phosphorus lyase complex subunit [Agrobacterium albertimagni AOL15]
MLDVTSSLDGGFPDAVTDAQSVFRSVMDAMARPGSIGDVDVDVTPPAPLGIAAGALLLTLCDHDTPIWLTPALTKSALPGWIGFHTGASLTSTKTDAKFAFVEAGAPVPSLTQFALGTQEYPDRSTTLVVEVAALEGGQSLQLSGPGIRDTAMIAPKGLPETFLRQWTDNRALFPRGVDLVLTAGRRFIALPRTTKIREREA